MSEVSERFGQQAQEVVGVPIHSDYGQNGVSFLSPPDDRIVLFGQSCSGKTTFAKRLQSHHYFCFDAMFPWHDLEGVSLSCRMALSQARDQCDPPPYVLDGWHLSDSTGEMLPLDACVYVIYADYDRVLSQYRIPVTDREEFRSMHDRWYHQVDYSLLPGVRYFANQGVFVEMPNADFQANIKPK